MTETKPPAEDAGLPTPPSPGRVPPPRIPSEPVPEPAREDAPEETPPPSPAKRTDSDNPGAP